MTHSSWSLAYGQTAFLQIQDIATSMLMVDWSIDQGVE